VVGNLPPSQHRAAERREKEFDMKVDKMQEPTWNHPEGERDVMRHDRFDDGLVLRGLGVAVGVIVAVSLVLWAVLASANVGSVSGPLASYATSLSVFVGFLAAGLYVGTHAVRDRMLQVAALVVLGLAMAAVGTVLDVAFGFWIGNLMPGNDQVNGAQVHFGFWAISWVAVPTAAFLAASVVPRGGQSWGTRTSEPEDTEI
jgi:hypothetical protein